MHKFFCLSFNVLDDIVSVDDQEQIHHMKNVLRLKPGEEVDLFDEKGNEYDCIVEKVSDKAITFVIAHRHLAPPKQEGVGITVACAIPKNVKMDDIVDKLTQLGVERIIPLDTKRVIVRLSADKKKQRLERWQKIALSASKQSKRNFVPVIEPIQSMEEALSNLKNFDLKLIPTLDGERKSLKELGLERKPQNVIVFIGPEGDFTDEEVALAKKNGCIPVTLGNLVLRVDTAAIALASFFRLYGND